MERKHPHIPLSLPPPPGWSGEFGRGRGGELGLLGLQRRLQDLPRLCLQLRVQSSLCFGG